METADENLHEIASKYSQKSAACSKNHYYHHELCVPPEAWQVPTGGGGDVGGGGRCGERQPGSVTTHSDNGPPADATSGVNVAFSQGVYHHA